MGAQSEELDRAGSTEPKEGPDALPGVWGIAARLREAYGSPQWATSGDPLDELVATILSQHTSDNNSARAYATLRRAFPTWGEVLKAPTDAVASAIHAGGLANIKAPRIQIVLQVVSDELGELSLDMLRSMPLVEARSWLQRLPGVGPKTAACVLLFSLGLPVMPVDTHVHRTSRRLGLISEHLDANAAHIALEALLGSDRDAIFALHMNLIAHGRTVCKARVPACISCVLSDLCPSSRASADPP